MNDKKALFYYPNTANTPNIPNGIAILSGIANAHGWEKAYFDTFSYEKRRDSMEDRQTSGEFKNAHIGEAKTKDFDAMVRDTQTLIDTFKPNVIAISCMTFEYEFLMKFWHLINVPNDTLIIIGGFHCIIKADEVVASKMFDICCNTEGEQCFDDLLTLLENQLSIANIDGTYYYNKLTQEVTRNPRGNLLSKDELWNTDPDYSMFDDSYFQYPFDGKIYRRFGFEVSRGCPYDCTYCGNTALKTAFDGLGKFVRTRPVESMIKDMKRMVDEFNIEMFYLQDECFLAHPLPYLEELAERYGAEIRKPFIIQTRAETINERRIQILKNMNAPFFQVSMGVESGSDEILKGLCSRNTRNDKLIEAFQLLHEHDIRTAGFFMLGFPFETREQIFETIDLCRQINPTVSIVSIFQPLPGQRLTDIAIEAGFITGEESLLSFTEGSILTPIPQIDP